MQTLVCLTTALFLCGYSGMAAKKKQSARSGNGFDFYLFSLSYAPDFCDQPGGRKDPRECGPGRKIGFVVHGLWPNAETGRGPENCGGSPVKASIVQQMLAYIPSAGLIQHEWTTHGTCSGLTADAYFAQVRQARDAVKIPTDLAQPVKAATLAASQIEAKFGASNPGYPKDAFRTSCYNDGELQEVRVCLTKDLKPRGCPVSVRDCTRPGIELKPVR